MNKTRRTILLTTLILATLVFSACGIKVIRGSGDMVSESRNVSGFDRVSLSGSGEVIITQGGEESLSVETDDNIMQYVKTEVRGGTLYLEMDEQGAAVLSPTRLTFTLSVKQLAGLSVSGSGDIEVDDIDTERMALDISGSGDIQIDSLATEKLEMSIDGSGDVRVDSLSAEEVESRIGGSGEVNLAGEAPTQNVEISGSGQYRAGNLQSETIEISIGGSGDAVVWATGSLKADISGSGSVKYYGSPTVDFSGSGSGDINSLGEK